MSQNNLICLIIFFYNYLFKTISWFLEDVLNLYLIAFFKMNFIPFLISHITLGSFIIYSYIFLLFIFFIFLWFGKKLKIIEKLEGIFLKNLSYNILKFFIFFYIPLVNFSMVINNLGYLTVILSSFFFYYIFIKVVWPSQTDLQWCYKIWKNIPKVNRGLLDFLMRLILAHPLMFLHYGPIILSFFSYFLIPLNEIIINSIWNKGNNTVMTFSLGSLVEYLSVKANFKMQNVIINGLWQEYELDIKNKAALRNNAVALSLNLNYNQQSTFLTNFLIEQLNKSNLSYQTITQIQQELKIFNALWIDDQTVESLCKNYINTLKPTDSNYKLVTKNTILIKFYLNKEHLPFYVEQSKKNYYILKENIDMNSKIISQIKEGQEAVVPAQKTVVPAQEAVVLAQKTVVPAQEAVVPAQETVVPAQKNFYIYEPISYMKYGLSDLTDKDIKTQREDACELFINQHKYLNLPLDQRVFEFLKFEFNHQLNFFQSIRLNRTMSSEYAFDAKLNEFNLLILNAKDLIHKMQSDINNIVNDHPNLDGVHETLKKQINEEVCRKAQLDLDEKKAKIFEIIENYDPMLKTKEDLQNKINAIFDNLDKDLKFAEIIENIKLKYNEINCQIESYNKIIFSYYNSYCFERPEKHSEFLCQKFISDEFQRIHTLKLMKNYILTQGVDIKKRDSVFFSILFEDCDRFLREFRVYSELLDSHQNFLFNYVFDFKYSKAFDRFFDVFSTHSECIGGLLNVNCPEQLKGLFLNNTDPKL